MPDNENIDKWIDMNAHSNIVTCFDCFKDQETGYHFSMTELHNGGTMFDYIRSLRLDLSLDVTRKYRELVYDVAIQVATGLDAAHNSGLVHGNLDLSKIMIQNNDEHLEFKITDFQPGSSSQQNLTRRQVTGHSLAIRKCCRSVKKSKCSC